MKNQNESSSRPQQDFTLPLILSGVVTAIVCIGLCGVLYLARNFINSDLAPRLGVVTPTPVALKCPSVQSQWEVKMEDVFDDNQLEWPVGKDSNNTADTNAQIKDGQLMVNLATHTSTFSEQVPRTNKSLTSFYLKTQMRQVDGPEDGEYGLIFRVNGSDIYFFYIRNNGRAILQKWNSTHSWDMPLYNQYPITIKPGEMNELVVLNTEGQTKFCVNGNIAFNMDSVGYSFGRFGVGASIHQDEQSALFKFDNFILYAPAP